MKLNKLLVLILICSMPLFAQDELSKVATGMGQFLKIGVGARGTALGDAYASQVADFTAMYWNPAGMQKIKKNTVGVSRSELYADITLDYLGAVYVVDASTSVGLSVTYLNSGDIELTTEAEPEGTGQTFDASNMALGVSVARSLTNRFDLGVTIKLVTERYYREEASTLAFDVGSQFDTGIYGMKLGMALTNFGGKMKLDGSDLDKSYTNEETQAEFEAGSRLKTEEWPLPLVFRLGVSADLIGKNSEVVEDDKNRLTILLEGNDPVDHYLRYNMGLEYEYSEFLALRAGYKSNYDAADWTAGFGMDFSKFGIDARLDYSFNNYGILDYVHNYSIEFHF